MNQPQGRELSWQVHGLTIAGRAWGDPGARPLLALHGWLDNADSFSRLGPALDNRHVVALDLTGHGRSSHRSEDATYQIWDDLPEIIGVLDQLGWQQFDLMGHSRGAFIASLLAGACPERVRRLVLLDGVAPAVTPDAKFSRQLRRFLEDKQRLLSRDPRVLASREEAAALRAQRSGLDQAAARIICDRNLKPVPGGFCWTTDPRLGGASAVRLNEGQRDTVWQALTMPTLLVLAEQGVSHHQERLQQAATLIPDLRVDTFPGGHHFLIEGDAVDLAGRIEQFLQESA